MVTRNIKYEHGLALWLWRCPYQTRPKLLIYVVNKARTCFEYVYLWVKGSTGRASLHWGF